MAADLTVDLNDLDVCLKLFCFSGGDDLKVGEGENVCLSCDI